MFEQKQVLTDLVEALFKACEPLDRGDLLDREVIVEILGVQPQEGHWNQCVGRLKERMQDEREIAIWPEYGRGFRLLTVEEQLIKLPATRMKRARKQIRKAKRSVDAISDRSIPLHLRRFRSRQSEIMDAAHKDLAAQARLQRALYGKKEGWPQLRVPVEA